MKKSEIDSQSGCVPVKNLLGWLIILYFQNNTKEYTRIEVMFMFLELGLKMAG